MTVKYSTRAHTMPCPSPARLRVREGHTHQFEKALDRYEKALALWNLHDNVTAESRMMEARAHLFTCAGFLPEGVGPDVAPTSLYARVYEEKVQTFTRCQFSGHNVPGVFTQTPPPVFTQTVPGRGDFCSRFLLLGIVDLSRLPTPRRNHARQEITDRGYPHPLAAHPQQSQ